MTKTELFTKAHQMTKAALQAGDDYRATFGASLRILMSESFPQLVGTEKQVAWASDIRAAFMNAAEVGTVSLRDYIEFEFDDVEEKLRDAVITAACEYLDDIASNTSAKYWIDNRSKIIQDAAAKTGTPRGSNIGHMLVRAADAGSPKFKAAFSDLYNAIRK